jgi:hypothetical protein
VSTELDGLPVLELHGLSPESAHELLLSVVSAHRNLDYAVARRIVAEAGGNPLAVQELAAELIDGSLTAAAPLAPLPLTSRLESRFLRLARAARRAADAAAGCRVRADRGAPGRAGGRPAAGCARRSC